MSVVSRLSDAAPARTRQTGPRTDNTTGEPHHAPIRGSVPATEPQELVNSRLRRLSLLCTVIAFGLLSAACQSDEDVGRVFFVELADGATVSSPLTVQMGAEDFVIEPATSGVNEGRGHLHLMVDAPCVEPRLIVPPDDQHLHFGKAQTSTELELPEGEHFLCLQAADGDHTALRPTAAITITVE